MSDDANGVLTPAETEASEQYAIGISFGNSNSSIAHISGEGKVEVIANEEGDRQIPSVLSYVDGEEYHGTQAKAQLVRNSKNTVAYFRDYLGKDYKSIDPTPCQHSARPIQSGSTTAFAVQDGEDGASHDVAVSDIATRLIRRLKSSASDFSGKAVTSAVVSIPTDSTEEQKAALSKAAHGAQVEILQFIPEPIAALVAYDSKATESASNKIVVVADFGGNRSDVAVVAARGGMYSILATAHDYSLGGAQLDQVLVEYFAKEFMKKHKTDPRSDARGLAKLKLESEAVKKSLSQSASATFSVESLADGIDFRASVNRTRYDTIGHKVFGKFTQLIEEAVQKANLDLLDVDEVIMSGGTSHTPKIAHNVKSMFPASAAILSPSTSTSALNPSELAARGAAIQASLIQEFEKEDIDQSTHEAVTVTPHLQNAIGLQMTGDKKGAFTLLIPQDSPAPVRRSHQFKAPAGDIMIRICEGEREIRITNPESKPKTNGATVEDDDSDVDSEEEEEDEIREKVWKVQKTLAEFTFKDLKKAAKIEVVINVDADLALSVTAREVGGKGGLRGEIPVPKATENGKA